MLFAELPQLIMLRGQRKALFNRGLHNSPPCMKEHVADLTCCRANPCVDHSATLTGRKREYWIEIQFADFRNVFDHAGDTEQDFLDSFDVRWSVTSITFEEAITADRTNHFLCIPVREWRNSKGNISEDLYVDPAKPEGDERPKQGIFRHANHQLDPTPDHFLYEN